MTIETTGNSFGIHLTERMIAAIKCMNDIGLPNLREMSLETAMKIFRAKVIPALTYVIDIVWENTIARQMENLEKVKATF